MIRKYKALHKVSKFQPVILEKDVAVIERPILFSDEMVRAILDGRKTQTRRIIKPQPKGDFGVFDPAIGFRFKGGPNLWCPYGGSGDRLWVRETWTHYDLWTPGKHGYGKILYRATDELGKYKKWHPSIHMERADCRLILEIISIRVERLNDISEEDAKAEGNSQEMIGASMFGGKAYFANSRQAFSNLWESINGAGSWGKNPWVWVIEFKKSLLLDSSR